MLVKIIDIEGRVNYANISIISHIIRDTNFAEIIYRIYFGGENSILIRPEDNIALSTLLELPGI